MPTCWKSLLQSYSSALYWSKMAEFTKCLHIVQNPISGSLTWAAKSNILKTLCQKLFSYEIEMALFIHPLRVHLASFNLKVALNNVEGTPAQCSAAPLLFASFNLSIWLSHCSFLMILHCEMSHNQYNFNCHQLFEFWHFQNLQLQLKIIMTVKRRGWGRIHLHTNSNTHDTDMYSTYVGYDATSLMLFSLHDQVVHQYEMPLAPSTLLHCTSKHLIKHFKNIIKL